jgi:SAM-dependent methyltransferase
MDLTERMTRRAVTVGVLLLGLVSAAGCGSASSRAPAASSGPAAPGTPKLDVIWVPSDVEVVSKMLEMAQVGPRDVVYDLGSGDGRIVITAAQRFGARAVGVELDPALIRRSRENAVRVGVADRVQFLEQDLFVTDLSEATVVTLYLLPEVNLRLRPKLRQELKPGSRIVSHDYDLGDWLPDKTAEISLLERNHLVFLWQVKP